MADDLLRVSIKGVPAVFDGEKWSCDDPMYEAGLNLICAQHNIVPLYVPDELAELARLATDKMGAIVVNLPKQEYVEGRVY